MKGDRTMAEIKIKISDNLFKKLPKKEKEIEEVLILGLKSLKTIHKKPAKGIVAKSFAALPIKDHNLIKEVIEQTKYGE